LALAGDSTMTNFLPGTTLLAHQLCADCRALLVTTPSSAHITQHLQGNDKPAPRTPRVSWSQTKHRMVDGFGQCSLSQGHVPPRSAGHNPCRSCSRLTVLETVSRLVNQRSGHLAGTTRSNTPRNIRCCQRCLVCHLLEVLGLDESRRHNHAGASHHNGAGDEGKTQESSRTPLPHQPSHHRVTTSPHDWAVRSEPTTRAHHCCR
jgi:hypothetical protein